MGGDNGETWEWDGLEWRRRDVGGPSPRYGHAMAYDAARDAVALFGGDTAAARVGDTWTWDGLAWAEMLASGAAPCSLSAMTSDTVRGV